MGFWIISQVAVTGLLEQPHKWWMKSSQQTKKPEPCRYVSPEMKIIVHNLESEMEADEPLWQPLNGAAERKSSPN